MILILAYPTHTDRETVIDSVAAKIRIAELAATPAVELSAYIDHPDFGAMTYDFDRHDFRPINVADMPVV